MKLKLSSLLLTLPLLAAAQGDPTGACYTAIWTNPAMDPVKAKLNSKEEGAAIKMRASAQKANAKEKKALEFWLDEIEKCRNLGNDFREKNYAPEILTIQRAFDLEMTSNLARLYAGRISWGEFIANRDKALNEMSDKGAAFEAKLKAQKDAQIKREAEESALTEYRRLTTLREDFQRQQQAEALAEAQRQQEQTRARQQQANSQQQMMNGLMLLEAARPRPSYPMPALNFGTTCTTRQGFGNTLQTNCQ